ncbi:hypothetical protein FIA58_020020 [Flavobacterium jejuense]|uniref:NusG domain-containing protein n=1 Tax=Flavobacterium jejuense TaxID=1544455 RepID=A0ABX0IZ37_9FLAO|nr:hypothetical protein [Flavobacterium jejuense]NHN27972.1 hypothetical protein [Flavobacterium jejuense]
MNFTSILKEKLVPVIIIGFLAFLIYYLNKEKSLEPKEIVHGKIIDIKIAVNIQTYYIYKFSFKNKIYKGSYLVDDINKKLLNRCFEIIVNINDPNINKLCIDKEVNCP